MVLRDAALDAVGSPCRPFFRQLRRLRAARCFDLRADLGRHVIPAGLGVLVLVPVLAGTLHRDPTWTSSAPPALPAPTDTACHG